MIACWIRFSRVASSEISRVSTAKAFRISMDARIMEFLVIRSLRLLEVRPFMMEDSSLLKNVSCSSVSRARSWTLKVLNFETFKLLKFKTWSWDDWSDEDISGLSFKVLEFKTFKLEIDSAVLTKRGLSIFGFAIFQWTPLPILCRRKPP